MNKLTMLETIPCLICGSDIDDQEKVIEIEEYPVHLRSETLMTEFRVTLCRECGLFYQNPRPTKELYQRYYDECSQFKRSDYNEGQDQLRKLQVDFLNRHISKKTTVVDVGCGTGYFLDLLKQDDWDVLGIEPSKAACAIAQEDFGLDVFHGFAEDYKRDRKFDVVCLRHVIEHLHDPVRMLKNLSDLLNPGGKIFLELQDVNQMDTIVISYFYFEHLFYFTPASITNLMQKSGLKITALEETRNPENCDSPYGVIRLLAEKEEDEVPKHWVYSYHEIAAKKDVYFKKRRQRYNEETCLGQISKDWEQKKEILAIWGASWHTVFIQRELGYGFDVDYYIDSNPEKIGTKFLGKPVISPEKIAENQIDEIVISSQAFEKEIYQQLLNLDFPSKKIRRIYE